MESHSDDRGAREADVYVQVQGRPAPTAPSDMEARLRAYREQLAVCVESHRKLEKALADRIRLLRFINALAARPAEQRSASLRVLPPDLATIAVLVLERMAQTPAFAARVAQALHRHEDAALAASAAASALAQSETVAPRSAWALMQDVKAERLLGRIYPLSTLDALFAGDPPLDRVFPTRQRAEAQERRTEPAARPDAVPAAPAAPAGPQPIAGPPSAVRHLQRWLDRLNAGNAPPASEQRAAPSSPLASCELRITPPEPAARDRKRSGLQLPGGQP